MTFQPGQSGNLQGNKNRTRRKGNAEIYNEIKNRGYLDPLLTLAKIQHESQNEGIRASAAASLAPYDLPQMPDHLTRCSISGWDMPFPRSETKGPVQ
jgi:hypothetical protein